MALIRYENESLYITAVDTTEKVTTENIEINVIHVFSNGEEILYIWAFGSC